MDPWGTPSLSYRGLDSDPDMKHRWERLLRYEVNHSRALGLRWYLASLDRRTS